MVTACGGSQANIEMMKTKNNQSSRNESCDSLRRTANQKRNMKAPSTRMPANTSAVFPRRVGFAAPFTTSSIVGRLVSWSCLILIAATAFGTPVRVDLRPDQTEIKDQNPRNSCNFFAVVAAMEAAYKRA